MYKFETEPEYEYRPEGYDPEATLTGEEDEDLRDIEAYDAYREEWEEPGE